jgi:hypothetical protein
LRVPLNQIIDQPSLPIRWCWNYYFYLFFMICIYIHTFIYIYIIPPLLRFLLQNPNQLYLSQRVGSRENLDFPNKTDLLYRSWLNSITDEVKALSKVRRTTMRQQFNPWLQTRRRFVHSWDGWLCDTVINPQWPS